MWQCEWRLFIAETINLELIPDLCIVHIVHGYVIFGMPNFKHNNLSIYLFFHFLSHALPPPIIIHIEFGSFYRLVDSCWKFHSFIYFFFLKEKISSHIVSKLVQKIIPSYYYFEILSDREFITILINIEQKSNIRYNKLHRNIRLSTNFSNWISLYTNMDIKKIGKFWTIPIYIRIAFDIIKSHVIKERKNLDKLHSNNHFQRTICLLPQIQITSYRQLFPILTLEKKSANLFQYTIGNSISSHEIHCNLTSLKWWEGVWRGWQRLDGQ